MVLMLSPLPEDSIVWYRPVRYIRGFLSMNIWVPLANLTYSIYLFHLVMFVCTEIAKGIVSNATGKTVPNSAPEETA